MKQTYLQLVCLFVSFGWSPKDTYTGFFPAKDLNLPFFRNCTQGCKNFFLHRILLYVVFSTDICKTQTLSLDSIIGTAKYFHQRFLFYLVLFFFSLVLSSKK